MYDKPGFTVHEPNPFLTPPLIFRDQHAEQQDRVETARAAQVASSEAAQREDAYLRALNPPRRAQIEPPALRSPDLPAEFAS
jgi:hypothetical protein